MGKINIEYVEDFDKLRNLNTYEGYMVQMHSDLDMLNKNSYKNENTYLKYMNDMCFDPINIFYSNVIFDGNFFTISNVYISSCNNLYVGLFNTWKESNICVKDLNIKNGVSVGKQNVGIMGGVLNGSLMNLNVCGCVIGQNHSGMLVGYSNERLAITGCNVDVYGPDVLVEKYEYLKERKNNINKNRVLKK